MLATNTDRREMYAELTVNGLGTEAALDTCYAGFFSTTSAEAEELQLCLEKLAEPRKYDTQEGVGYLDQVARHVSVELLGKEMMPRSEVTTKALWWDEVPARVTNRLRARRQLGAHVPPQNVVNKRDRRPLPREKKRKTIKRLKKKHRR
nr:uncharacterized protein LOC113808247 [Penaeus vannamei]